MNPPMRTLTPNTSVGTQGSALADGAMYVGAVLLLTPQLVRATTNITIFPDWDLSPMVYSLRTPALGPSASILCDAITTLGAAVLLLFAWLSRPGVRLPVIASVLALVGIVGVLLHTHAGDRSIGDLRVGASWVAAALSALAIFISGQDARVRRLLSAVVLGFVVLLLLRGAQQVFIEHPQTIENFRANKDRVLAAHGWSPGSPMALGFERRLSQPEASAWFGLSNVYASLAAGMAAALLAMCLGARTKSRPEAIGIGLAFLGSVACVLLAGGKGGVIALGIGLFSVAIITWSQRKSAFVVIARGLPVLAILGGLALVAVRGAVGERIGELSIFFRWFYVQAATRIFASHPLQGVGPDGFQQAFLLAKPPLCPEEVTSPHSIAFDWLSTLGVFGIGWIALLVFAAWRIGRASIADSQPETSSSPIRAEYRTALAIPTIATLAVTWLESPFIVPEMAAVRILGVIGWCVLAFAVMRAWSSRHASIGLAAGAIALLAHAQIEVTASFVSSSPLWAMLIALAATGGVSRMLDITVSAPRNVRSRLLLAMAALALLIAFSFAFPALTRVRSQETYLRTAADLIRVIPAFGERLRALETPSATTPFSDVRETPDGIAKDFSIVLGRTVSSTAQDLGRAMNELELRQIKAADKPLIAAYELDRTDRRPLRELSTLLVRQGELALARGDRAEATRAFPEAAAAMRVQELPAPKSGDWAWLATVHQKVADALNDPVHLTNAIAAREKCAELDPYNLPNTVALAKLLDRSAKPKDAAAWAKKALELDDLARLDRAVRGLSDADRDAVRSIAQRDGGVQAPTPPRP